MDKSELLAMDLIMWLKFHCDWLTRGITRVFEPPWNDPYLR